MAVLHRYSIFQIHYEIRKVKMSNQFWYYRRRHCSRRQYETPDDRSWY